MHQLKAEFDHLKELELLRRHEVCRLEALVEAERLQFSLTEHRLQQLLAEEQLRAERLRLLREDALAQKSVAHTCTYTQAGLATQSLIFVTPEY